MDMELVLQWLRDDVCAGGPPVLVVRSVEDTFGVGGQCFSATLHVSHQMSLAADTLSGLSCASGGAALVCDCRAVSTP